MPSFVDNLENLNLTRNPFDPAPLEPSERDMQLFVGRSDEIREIKNILASVPKGLYRIVVMGAYGIGKTSFLNRIFWEAQNYKELEFATIKLIAKEDMTFLSFLLSFIDKLIDILRRVDLNGAQEKTVEEIKMNLDFERQVGSESRSEITGTLNAVIASLAGKLGVSESEIRKPYPWTERSALRDLTTLIDLAFEFYDGIVFGIDEVDYLASRKAMEVLRKGREEIFQRRNFLFIFSGTLRFRSLLNKIGSPVREIIDKFVILQPFRYPEERNIVNQLVDLRFKNASKDKMTYTNPFDKESMELVFTLSGGTPRRILRFFQISMDAGLASSTSVTTTTVLSAIRELGAGHNVGLPILHRDIIKVLARKEAIREDDFKEIRKKFSLSEEKEKKIRASLEGQGLLNSDFIGTDTIYSLAPELRVYVLHESKMATPVLQIEAAQKLRQTIPDESDAKAKKTHLKYANLLEGQGHLGLLKVEYDRMNKQELISHCEKAISCIQGLHDTKLGKVAKNVTEAIDGLRKPKHYKAAKEKLAKAERQLKDYANSVFEPRTDPTGGRRLVFVHDGKAHSIDLSNHISFRDIVLYESLQRDRDTRMRTSVKWRLISQPKKKPEKKTKKGAKKKRSFLSKIFGGSQN